VATQQISTHWLRHTTLTWVERNFGYAIARAYAGHTDSISHAAPPPPTSEPASPRPPPRWPRSLVSLTRWPQSVLRWRRPPADHAIGLVNQRAGHLQPRPAISPPPTTAISALQARLPRFAGPPVEPVPARISSVIFPARCCRLTDTHGGHAVAFLPGRSPEPEPGVAETFPRSIAVGVGDLGSSTRTRTHMLKSALQEEN
jgi:hypothetical protein